MPLNLKSTRRTFMSSLGVMAGAVAGAMSSARGLFANAPRPSRWRRRRENLRLSAPRATSTRNSA